MKRICERCGNQIPDYKRADAKTCSTACKMALRRARQREQEGGTFKASPSNMQTITLASTWRGIMQRCHNEKSGNYRNYGARGITVYEPWRTNPDAFIEWVLTTLGPRPEVEYESGRTVYSLDRIDNDKGYEPGNLKWSNQSEQTSNRRGSPQYRKRRRAELVSRLESVAGSTSDDDAAEVIREAIAAIRQDHKLSAAQ